jgi:hypothetical protein
MTVPLPERCSFITQKMSCLTNYMGLFRVEVSRHLSERNSTFHFYIIYFSSIIKLSRINLGHKHLPRIASKLGVTLHNLITKHKYLQDAFFRMKHSRQNTSEA